MNRASGLSEEKKKNLNARNEGTRDFVCVFVVGDQYMFSAGREELKVLLLHCGCS